MSRPSAWLPIALCLVATTLFPSTVPGATRPTATLLAVGDVASCEVETDELVADLSQEARELTDLVNELVDLAAGQSDNEPPQRVDLADVAEDVAGLARRRIGREVVVHASGSTVTDGRPGMLQRALSNLVENAAKFDRDGTAPIEISVSGFTLAGPVRVEVLDRGPGIADADLVRVFDRFYRAADARSLPGSGLGLSIVREVALSHGGAPFAFPREGGGTVIGFTVGGDASGG